MYFTGSISSSRARHWLQISRCSSTAARLESASLSSEYSSSAPSERWPLMACSTALRSSEGIDCGSTTDGVALRLTPLSVVGDGEDRKSTRLNSSHRCISYAVFCLKKTELFLLRNCFPHLQGRVERPIGRETV